VTANESLWLSVPTVLRQRATLPTTAKPTGIQAIAPASGTGKGAQSWPDAELSWAPAPRASMVREAVPTDTVFGLVVDTQGERARPEASKLHLARELMDCIAQRTQR
jgi:hypothetical protein